MNNFSSTCPKVEKVAIKPLQSVEPVVSQVKSVVQPKVIKPAVNSFNTTVSNVAKVATIAKFPTVSKVEIKPIKEIEPTIEPVKTVEQEPVEEIKTVENTLKAIPEISIVYGPKYGENYNPYSGVSQLVTENKEDVIDKITDDLADIIDEPAKTIETENPVETTMFTADLNDEKQSIEDLEVFANDETNFVTLDDESVEQVQPTEVEEKIEETIDEPIEEVVEGINDELPTEELETIEEAQEEILDQPTETVETVDTVEDPCFETVDDIEEENIDDVIDTPIQEDAKESEVVEQQAQPVENFEVILEAEEEATNTVEETQPTELEEKTVEPIDEPIEEVIDEITDELPTEEELAFTEQEIQPDELEEKPIDSNEEAIEEVIEEIEDKITETQKFETVEEIVDTQETEQEKSTESTDELVETKDEEVIAEDDDKQDQVDQVSKYVQSIVDDTLGNKTNDKDSIFAYIDEALNSVNDYSKNTQPKEEPVEENNDQKLDVDDIANIVNSWNLEKYDFKADDETTVETHEENEDVVVSEPIELEKVKTSFEPKNNVEAPVYYDDPVAVDKLTQKLEKERVLREQMLEQTKQIKLQVKEYENELDSVNDSMSKTNKILNFVLTLLIMTLFVILFIIGFWFAQERGLL